MLILKVILVSTREGRKGYSIANWVFDVAKQHTAFETELVDLKEINLPMLDEPNHPRIQQYQHQHTKDWSAKMALADAFIIVTPEYNYGYPASIKNALDYLYNEWMYKPVAFVSYGGVAAGTRAVQMLRQVVISFKMITILDSINIPFFAKYIDEQGKFNADEGLNKATVAMLNELAKWGEALKAMRAK